MVVLGGDVVEFAVVGFSRSHALRGSVMSRRSASRKALIATSAGLNAERPGSPFPRGAWERGGKNGAFLMPVLL